MKNKEKDRIKEWIKEGKKYKEVKELAIGEGITTDFHNSFYKWAQEVFPSEKMEEALEGSKIRRVEREQKEHKDKRKVLWNSKKQKEADESKLAELINQAVYHGTFKFCRSKELKIEDVNEINLGGGIVATVMYFLPDVNLDHPAIVLTTRAILFYIRFKTICASVREKLGEVESAAKDMLSGVKPEWK